MATYIIQRCFGLDTRFEGWTQEKLQSAYKTAQANGQTNFMSAISDHMAKNNMSSTTSIAVTTPTPKPTTPTPTPKPTTPTPTPKPTTPTPTPKPPVSDFAKGVKSGKYRAYNSVSGFTGSLNNMWTRGGFGGKAAIVGGSLLAAKGVASMFNNNNKEKDNRGQSY